MVNYITPTEEEVSKVGNLFKIIGDKTRLKLIFSLLESEKTVNELAETTLSSQSLVSHQLKILKTNHIVGSKKNVIAFKTDFLSHYNFSRTYGIKTEAIVFHNL